MVSLTRQVNRPQIFNLSNPEFWKFEILVEPSRSNENRSVSESESDPLSESGGMFGQIKATATGLNDRVPNDEVDEDRVKDLTKSGRHSDKDNLPQEVNPGHI